MSDKSTLLRAFNTLFFDFLNDIITIFPENTDIAVAKTTFETIKKANPTVILKAWHMFVYTPYKEVIQSGDINFFFEKDYGKDLEYMANANDIMKTIDKIRNPIKEMDAVNKAHSMQYIQKLCKITVLYNQL